MYKTTQESCSKRLRRPSSVSQVLPGHISPLGRCCVNYHAFRSTAERPERFRPRHLLQWPTTTASGHNDLPPRRRRLERVASIRAASQPLSAASDGGGG